MSLFKSVQYNNIEEVKQSLSRWNVNVLNKCHQSLLYVACEHGNTEIADLLIKNGALVNHGAKPLVAAARNGYAKCVDLLLKAGASAHSSNQHGISAMQLACENQDYCIVEMLVDYGAKPCDADKVLRSLTARHGYASLAKKLLEKRLLAVMVD